MFLLLLHEEAPTARVKTILFFRFLRHKIVYLQIKLRKMLFDIEDQYNPIDVMFLYKIIEWVGVLADQAQRVGSRIELMLARS